jgi:hypothetical protein
MSQRGRRDNRYRTWKPRLNLALFLALLAWMGPANPVQARQDDIDPQKPIKDLLPSPPDVYEVGPITRDDLTLVPEVELQAPLARDSQAFRSTALLLARIDHINQIRQDGFLKALIAERPNLTGLPFAMGDACRSDLERSKQFTVAVQMVREAMAGERARNPDPPEKFWERARNPNLAEKFWERLETLCKKQDIAQTRTDQQGEHITLARIAALMQILAPEAPPYRLGLVKYLAAVQHPEATRALARLAVFSAEDEVRLAAVNALLARRERNYTDVLLSGLHYPWPRVARNAADAIVRLKRDDLMPQLVALLEEPDPRTPQVQEVDSKQVTVVKELVRINHHRNCAMCHAPGINGEVTDQTLLTAGVPLPNEPLVASYRRTQRRETLVRIDMTYLRQDFSILQPVADAKPWPEMQRFDFLVRTRQVDAEEAATYRALFASSDPTRLSPYQQAALAALREMTGRDTAPTAQAWRKLLELPSKAPAEDKGDISTDGPITRLR